LQLAKKLLTPNFFDMWDRFTSSILNNRILYITLILAIAGFMGYKGKNVELAYAGAKILPVTDPAYVAYNQFKDQFGEDGTIFVIGLRSDKIFEKDFLNEWQDLGNDLKAIEGIQTVLSVAHAFELHKDTVKKSFYVKPLKVGSFQSQEACDSLQNRLAALPFYSKLLYNPDSNSTLMAVNFSRSMLNSNRRAERVQAILDRCKEFELKQGVSLHYSGLPFIRSIIATKVSAEFKLFLTLSIIITALILLLFFRSIYAVIFPILVVLIGVVFTIGIIVLLGYQITLLTGLIPPLIVVIGIPNSILFLNKYHTEYMLSQDKFKALGIAIKRIGVTTFFANVTTAIGFGVFAFTNSEILTQFGIVASVNVMITWILSLIMIPIIFSILPPPKSWQTKHLENKFLSKFIIKLDYLVHHRSKAIYFSTALLVVASVIGMTRINVNGYMVDDLPQNDPVLTDLKFFERNFDGALPLEIQIDSKRKNGLLNIPTIKKIEKLDLMVSAYPEFSRGLSLNEVLKFSKQAFYNGDPAFYKLPTEAEAAFIIRYAKNSGTSSGTMMKSYVDSLNQKTRVSFQMQDVGSKRMNALLDELRLRTDSIFNPEKFDVLFTGSSVIFIEGTNYLLRNLLESLIIAVVLIAALMLILFRTPSMVFISLVPNIIPLMITAGIMGFFNISLKPSTILIFSIAFGIASDQTLYFLTRFRHERKTADLGVSRIITMTLKETGLSMIYTAVILFFGFGIFAASNFGGTVSLGILISITLVLALVSNLILLPTLLLSLDKKTKERNTEISENE
jgi:hypothetical protein